jgi:tetratricopeptide (TPR) repeat protein
MCAATAPSGLSGEELAVLGQGLPPEISLLLHQAAASYSVPEISESFLHEAARSHPDHASVLIARYRFFFYQGRLEEALDVADLCLEKALRALGLAEGWRNVRPDQCPFGNWGAVLPRFFLFSLKGWAYLRMRLGDLEKGREAVEKLLELDPTDKIGARTLLGVLDRGGRDDDE